MFPTNTLSNKKEEVILEEGTIQQSALSHFETFNNVLLVKTPLYSFTDHEFRSFLNFREKIISGLRVSRLSDEFIFISSLAPQL